MIVVIRDRRALPGENLGLPWLGLGSLIIGFET